MKIVTFQQYVRGSHNPESSWITQQFLRCTPPASHPVVLDMYLTWEGILPPNPGWYNLRVFQPLTVVGLNLEVRLVIQVPPNKGHTIDIPSPHTSLRHW